MNLQDIDIRKCQAGDSKALEDLFVTIYPFIEGIVRVRIANITEAEDLTAQAVLKIFENLGKYDPTRGSLKTWIGRISVNVVFDYLRRKERIHFIGIEASDVGIEDFPDTEAVDQLDRVHLVYAFSLLTQDQKDLLWLRYIAGLPLSDIVEMQKWGKSMPTVRKHLKAANEALRGYLSELSRSEESNG